jgi:hypothetical protein
MSRAFDDKMRQEELKRISEYQKERTAELSKPEAADPYAGLTGMEKRMNVLKAMVDKDISTALTQDIERNKLEQAQRITNFMTPEMMKAMYLKNGDGSVTSAASQVATPGVSIESPSAPPEPARFKIGQAGEALPAEGAVESTSMFVKRTPVESLINSLDSFLNTETGRPKFPTTTSPVPKPIAVAQQISAVPNRQSIDRFIPWETPESKAAMPGTENDFIKTLGPDGVPRFKSKRRFDTASQYFK